MRRYWLPGLLVTAGMLIGCESQPKVVSNPPPGPQAAQAIRQNYQKLDPNIRVGSVIAVDAPDHLVAVGDVPLKDFRLGDTISILDGKQSVLAVGNVVFMTKDALHVRYTPRAGIRGPQVGDLAIRATE